MLPARQQAQMRHQMAEDSKNEYSACLQKFNQEQNEHYYTLIPHIFQRIQDMEERRIQKVGESMKTFAEVDRQVLPIVGKCLDGMTKAAESIEPKSDSNQVIESYKSGFEPPGDVEFEDYSQPMKRTASDTSLSNSRNEGKPDKPISKSKGKLWPFIKKNKPRMCFMSVQIHQLSCSNVSSPKQHKEPLSHRLNEFMTSKPKMHCFRSLKRGTVHVDSSAAVDRLCTETPHSSPSVPKGSGPEDFSHLPPEQRRKKLQAKIDEINKDIQKEMDQREALTKMKDVYLKNPQMGDPSSVDPRLAEISQNIEKLRLELQKFDGWLAEVEGRMPVRSDSSKRQSGMFEAQNNAPVNNNCAQDRESWCMFSSLSSPDGSYTEERSSEAQVKEFDDEFDDEEPLPTIGTCKVLYPFEGQNEGTISVAEGEVLHVIEEDKGDGWTRVRRNDDEEGYVPTSYVEVFLENTKEVF
ncbi:formin-binding protein 1-like [Scleropages formosus]|uniref:Formin-binding protein 1-like n=1 Tax=Scleropages formosus TaxID=113540 RepID=A0A0P7XKU8_SCLFO|nr:formin-binding protein 1-like [Scleropages formosus]